MTTIMLYPLYRTESKQSSCAIVWRQPSLLEISVQATIPRSGCWDQRRARSATLRLGRRSPTMDGDPDGTATVDMGVHEVLLRAYLPLVLRAY